MYVVTIQKKDGAIEYVYRPSKHDAGQIASLARGQGKKVLGIRNTLQKPKQVQPAIAKPAAIQLELFPDLFKSQKGK